MPRLVLYVLIALVMLGIPAAAEDTNIVFRSDVSLVRVDAQVVDRSNRTITGLKVDDFVLLEDGQKMTIRNFESEDMPVDILLLLDVSGSMQPHIERLSNAAHQALQVLGRGDRVAIMVFDRQTRLRMPFRNNLDVIEQELENVLRQETFDGGTDITRGMLDAANYIGREGRKDARRAIVILTDDQTERDRDDQTVLSALNRADTVMSALIAPDAMHGRYGGHGGGGGGGWPRSGGGSTWPSGGGSTWPSGGGMGYPGGIPFPRRGSQGPYGGRGGGQSGPVIMRSRTKSAGTAEIAKQSGGDSMRVDDASALDTTLLRLRQRYALHFNLPEGVKPGQERNIQVMLADTARNRYPGSEVRYRRTYSGGTSQSDPVMVSRTPTSPGKSTTSSTSSTSTTAEDRPTQRRRPAVNEDGTAIENSQTNPNGGWRRSDEPEPANSGKGVLDPAPPAANDTQPTQAQPTQSQPAQSQPAQPQQGGWRRVKPGEQP